MPARSALNACLNSSGSRAKVVCRAVGAVMIPKIVRQSLRLNGLNAGLVDRKGGPVSESWQWRWN